MKITQRRKQSVLRKREGLINPKPFDRAAADGLAARAIAERVASLKAPEADKEALMLRCLGDVVNNTGEASALRVLEALCAQQGRKAKPVTELSAVLRRLSQ